MNKSLILSIALSSSVFATTYVVKHGDTLSSILHKLGRTPLYGKNGSVKKTKALNTLRDVNIIYEGQEIKIEKEEDSQLSNNDVEFKCVQTTCDTPILPPESPIKVTAMDTQESYKVSAEFGSVEFFSSSPTGNLKLFGGSNKFKLNHETIDGSFYSNFAVSADYLKINPNLDFPISSTSALLIQTEIAAGLCTESNEFHAGVGIQDIMGTVNTLSDGIQLKKARSPYLTIGVGQSILGLNLKLDGQYFFHAEKDQYEIKNGNQFTFEISKSLYESKSFKLNAFIKHQEQSIKTRLTDDKETKNLLGFDIGF